MRRGKLLRGFGCVLVLVGVTALLAACGSGSSTTGGSSSGGSSSGEGSSSTVAASGEGKICAPEQTVGYVDIYAGSPIEMSMHELAEEAAKQLGWQFKFADAQANYSKMQSQIQNFVNEKVDLIIIASTDAAPIREQLQAAKSAGIPVVEVGGGDLDPQHLFTARYNENEEKLGELLGKYMVEQQPEAKIADLQITLNYSGQARDKGLHKAVEASGGSAEIVAEQQIDPSNEIPSTTKTLTDMLTADPEINQVFAVYDTMSRPAASVLREKQSDAELFSNFTTPSNLELMEAGQLTAVVDTNLSLTPAVAFDQALKVAKSGGEFEQDAVDKAGGLGYRVVSSPEETYEWQETLAPFLEQWAKEYPCK